MFRRNKGFTLIELLVVIAIIAVLAAILFPVFARAREQARGAQCLSNMKQLGTALAMYIQDNEGGLPGVARQIADASGDAAGEVMAGHSPVAAGAEPYARTYSVRGLLEPYVKNGGVWKCPSDTNVDPSGTAGKKISSYHYRHYFLVGTASIYGQPLWTYTDTNFEKPAQTYSFCEVTTYHDNRPGLVNMKGDAKMNFVFLDGHAKGMPVDKACGGTEATGYDYHWPKQVPTWGIQNTLQTPSPDIAD